MSEAIFWGGLQRFIEAATEAAPTILVGLVIAGVFRRLLGHETTRKFFGFGTWRELPQAWLIGMLLPVCSLGVIPIARELHRAGLRGGTILAFALTAPLFNPLSVLYGLSLSDPVVILSFALCSLTVVTVVGAVWDKMFPGRIVAEPEPPKVAYGLRRMASIAVVGAREMAGPSLALILIGLSGVVLLSSVLSPGSLQSSMEHDNPYAPLTMTAVAIPAYATPMVAMAQIGSMFQHGNSVAAAFVLLTLGAGLNLGLIFWVVRSFGLKRSAAWFGILLCVVLGLAYSIDAPLYPKGIDPPGHTHAFDGYCRPFDSGGSELASTVFHKLQDEVMPHEARATGVLLTFVLAGLILRRLDRRWRIEDWLERFPAEVRRSKYDINVPAPVLGGVALIGLITFSVLGCFMYYPPPQQIFEDMTVIQAEVLSAANSGDREHAEYFIPVWQDWARRLQVSVYLREGHLSDYRRAKADVFLDKVEWLKHAIEDEDEEETRQFVSEVGRAYRRMRSAYLDGG